MVLKYKLTFFFFPTCMEKESLLRGEKWVRNSDWKKNAVTGSLCKPVLYLWYSVYFLPQVL